MDEFQRAARKTHAGRTRARRRVRAARRSSRTENRTSISIDCTLIRLISLYMMIFLNNFDCQRKAVIESIEAWHRDHRFDMTFKVFDAREVMVKN